jgi:hypothetical protein
MRKVHSYLAPALFVAALALALPMSLSAQNREKFIISARAGGVNAVTGKTSMRPHGNTDWHLLTIKEDLETGDFVKTEGDGRVELLLNPGSYLRVGENSEFQLVDSSLENLEVRLLRGTAIVEVTGADDESLYIGITTPHTRMSIIRRGLYRVNVAPEDNTELIVRKGRVILEDSHTKVKGGDKVVFSGGSFSVAKAQNIDKKNADSLEVWSKERAHTLAEANRNISRQTLAAFASSFRNDWSLSGGFTRRYGFWLYSPGSRCYTFMPLEAGWGSPYGAGYASSFYGGCGCRTVWLAPGYDWRGYPIPGGTVGSVVTAPGATGGGVTSGSSRGAIVDSPMSTHGKPDISPGGDGPAMRPPIKE